MIKKCKICNGVFKVPPSKIKKGYGRFCSSKCYGLWRKTLVGERHPLFERIKKTCLSCKRKFFAKPGYKFCSLSCYWKSLKGKRPIHLDRTGKKSWCKGKTLPHYRGANNHLWKGGKYHKKSGYIGIISYTHPFRDKHSYVPEHRIVIEKIIGRYLKPTEQVHHINKIKSDNRPQNLMAFKTDRSHKRFEHNLKFEKSDIIFDGRNYHS